MFSILGFFFIVILIVLIFLYFILKIKNQQTGSKSHRTVSYVILGFLTVSGLYYVFSGNNGSHSTSSSRRHYYYSWRYNNRVNDSHQLIIEIKKMKQF